MEFSLSKHEHKPLQVNPIKHSQPMGATLAYLGVKDCMPLMHSAQGCASYTKVFFTRHFNEPIAIRNTSVSDITAVLDGGDYSILMAIENIQNKEKNLKPSMIGLHTTGLTETKGDDVRGVGSHIEIPYVFVNTPDYEGGMESGWGLTVKAMIEQLTEPSLSVKPNKLVILPHLSMQPIEVEKIKTLCEDFGFETYALPDLSTSLDGYWDEGQGKLANGGITVDEIRTLATCATVITIGQSMKKSAVALQGKNPQIEHLHFNHVMGLDACDNFVAALMKIRQTEPKPLIKRWRARLQDAMLDSHFLIGSSHFVVTGEPDMLSGICALLRSVGGTITAAVSTTFSDVLHTIEAENVFVGDLEDARRFFGQADMVISNFHAERILHMYHNTALVIRGFPNYEELGNQLKNDQLYEGSAYFLFEIANELRKAKHES
ncbi:MAG: nitrogenase iron-molybdenum cofactor biosynthesis protein NifN [Sulfuricurvum sp.]|jgi:nitrogenase molybdenum-iron protein NifN|uniref:nitrogenase iron-molybdenum cofactor biosynthesis protein NifN n=1 Tax=Sulfuricurvum sp. TaxID=2025608 RepID=UPI0025DF67BE|nr:nitrogenase iron-molybdenum cofactor biosynthesis protein NifN [Sulfuricurvum sp.]MCK9372993.1 nitrogenase iron-molybdenum cofactor biosynthesis protein NifN [Sulfuricurvum sp.]